MVEEDKPKPEGEQPSAREEEERKRRRKGKKAKRKEAKLAEKSIDELVAEIFAEAARLSQLLREDDQKGVLSELDERIKHFYRLQTELERRPKKVGDYRKWAQALGAGKRSYFNAEERDIKEFKKEFDKRLEGLNNAEDLKKKAKDNYLSMEEYLQLKTIASINRAAFYNFQSNALGRMRLAEETVPDIHFQAEVAEVMLKVREEQTKTATILEKVEGRLESSEQVQTKTAAILEGVKENTNPAQQFKLIVLASAVVAISVGFVVDVILLGWGNEMVALLKERPLQAILLALMLVFAGLEIGTRVKKKGR